VEAFILGVYLRPWARGQRSYGSSLALRVPITVVFALYFALRRVCADILLLSRNPLNRTSRIKREKKLSYFTDLLDWPSGYPCEVAKPESVFDFCRKKGFELAKFREIGAGLGNNEFVFARFSEPSVP
jgi:hypothetical protein